MNKEDLVINQFSPSMSSGDGVSQGVFFTQKILLSLGYSSNIYANFIEQDLLSNVLHIDHYEENENNILIYHLSIGHVHHQQIMMLKDKKILAYHNITPAHFFLNQAHLQDACNKGREQLADARQYVVASYSDSAYNNNELLSKHYPHPTVIPLLVDINNIYQRSKIKYQSPFEYGFFNIIFVGRIVANKCQHQLIDVLFQIKKMELNQKVKLHLIGSISEPEYMGFIYHYTRVLELEGDIIIHGKVTSEKLDALYQHADLFLSLSEHEGFCMPALEAICYELPVLAYNCGGIRSVVKDTTLLTYKSAERIAKDIENYIHDPEKLQRISNEQQQYITHFEYGELKSKLALLIDNVITQ